MKFGRYIIGNRNRDSGYIILAFLIFLCLNFYSTVKAGGKDFKVVYLSPVPGSKYNLPETNIIIGVNKFIDENDLFNSAQFIVSGSRSGLHSGKFIISDDGKTIIFKPQKKISEYEVVNVRLAGTIKSQNGESIDSLSFEFKVDKENDIQKIQSQYIDEFENQNYSPADNQIQNKIVEGNNPAAIQDGFPTDFPKFNITVSNNPDPDYLFIGITSANNPYIMILDNNGRPVYYKKTPSGTYDFKVQPNGLLTYYDMKSGCYYAMDSTYAIVDSFKCENGYETDIHELRILPNGHALLIGRDTKTMDLSQVVSGGSSQASVIGNVIQELDKNKNVVFQWLCWDHLDITDTYFDIKQNTIDFTHANSIDIDDDGNLIVSIRNLQEIDKINRETGDIIWRFGGKKSQFKLLNDTLGFSWQHACRKLPNGDLILFDNGCKRLPAVLSFSRAVEYKLDTHTNIAELVWQFRNTPDVYSIGLGYAQRLNNGNTLIGWGAALPTITEVRPDGTKAFEMSFTSNLYSYRAYRFPWKIKNSNPTGLLFSTTKKIFNQLDVGDTSSFKLVIRNNNSRSIAINSITYNSNSFYTSLNIPTTVPAQDSISLEIYFKPDTSGFITDTLTINYDGGIEKISLEGNAVPTKVEDEVPVKFSLYQNYPNPFNQSTIIKYSIADRQRVTINIYNITGELVKALINKIEQAGNYSLRWNGDDSKGTPVSSGVYIYRISTGNFIKSMKMILLK